MLDWQTLRSHTIGYRNAIAALLAPETERAHIVPPTWNNNLHWHAGHLVTTIQGLTYGLAGEPLPIPPEYRRWFAKGTSPASWGDEPVPAFDQLVRQLVDILPPIFDAFEARAHMPYANPHKTSVGVVLSTPAEALVFSLGHDGIHLGMIQALKRGLNALTVAAAT